MRSFFMVRVKKGILRAVTLSINKAFIKPILTFLPFLTIKHLYVPGPCGEKWKKLKTSTIFSSVIVRQLYYDKWASSRENLSSGFPTKRV